MLRFSGTLRTAAWIRRHPKVPMRVESLEGSAWARQCRRALPATGTRIGPCRAGLFSIDGLVRALINELGRPARRRPWSRNATPDPVRDRRSAPDPWRAANVPGAARGLRPVRTSGRATARTRDGGWRRARKEARLSVNSQSRSAGPLTALIFDGDRSARRAAPASRPGSPPQAGPPRTAPCQVLVWWPGRRRLGDGPGRPPAGCASSDLRMTDSVAPASWPFRWIGADRGGLAKDAGRTPSDRCR
jgi:hypothetical protein